MVSYVLMYVFMKSWCKVPEDSDDAETCRSYVTGSKHRFYNCALVDVTKVLMYHNARNEQYKSHITFFLVFIRTRTRICVWLQAVLLQPFSLVICLSKLLLISPSTFTIHNDSVVCHSIWINCCMLYSKDLGAERLQLKFILQYCLDMQSYTFLV
jgi:hypothetical protein